MKVGHRTRLLIASVLGWASACGADEASSEGAFGNDSFDGGAFGPSVPPGSGLGGNASGGPQAGAGGAALPPEIETRADFELPHAGQRFVYAANPESDTVAVIDATTPGIEVVLAGRQPRFLQTLAGRDEAIVLNVESDDATIIRTGPDGSTVGTVDVQRGSNAIAVAPDGQHAVVYFDEAYNRYSQAPGSVQDVSVITFAGVGADVSTGMTVGFRPSRVFFSSDSLRAFVVTEDGVSILDFADIQTNGAGIARTVPVGATGIDKTLDVSVTSDGRYALAREEGGSELRLVDLESEEIEKLDVAALLAVPPPPPADGGANGDSGAPATDAAPPADAETPGDAGGDALPPGDGGGSSPPPGSGGASSVPPPAPPPVFGAAITDLDLSVDGTYALAVVRDQSAILRIPIPAAFADPGVATVTRVPGELIGQVAMAEGGGYALFYTTADPANERITILNLGAGSLRSVQLRKSVASVAIAPDDRTALVVHGKIALDPNEPGIDQETQYDRMDGYSLVRLEDGFPKLEVTPAPLGPFAIVPDGSYLFILFNAAALREVQTVELRSFQVGHVALGSPPLSVGTVPQSERVFVGQDHPDGRITLIDWKTGALQSVTGFELNSRIRE